MSEQKELLPVSEMIDRELVDLALESHARALLYPDSEAQHNRANECRDELLRRLTRTQPAEDERVQEIRDFIDSWRPFRCVPDNAELFERQSEKMVGYIRTLLSLLPVQPEYHDPLLTREEADLIVGAIPIRSLPVQPAQRCQHGLDVKDTCDECTAVAEFEQSLQPAASTPTGRCTCDHFEHKDTGECLTCGLFCGPVSNDVAQTDLRAWSGRDDGSDTWCDDCRGYTHRSDCPSYKPAAASAEAQDE